MKGNGNSGPSAPARVAVFTHDTFGMGDVRRCLRILSALSEAAPGSALLLVTGSPALSAFSSLPPNVDVVKVPTAVSTGSRSSRSPHLPIARAEVAKLRRDIIRQVVIGFAPDVFLVDNFPLGSENELLDTLHELRGQGARIVLGLRDVLDAPDVIRGEWERQGMYELLERYFDRILVYGAESVLDVRTAYRMPVSVALRVHYCGYVTHGVDGVQDRDLRAALSIEGRFVVVTGGGGGDAYPLLKLSLEAMRQLPDTATVLVAGPLMKVAERDELRRLADGRADVRVVDQLDDLPRWLGGADAVISMCGYNTASEIAALGLRAVVVPRTWRYGEPIHHGGAGVEWEQLLRAQALTRLGYVQLLEPEQADSARLAEAVRSCLAAPRPAPAEPLRLDGVRTVTDQILRLIQERRRRA